MKKELAIHPYLLTFFPLLYTYSNYPGEAPYTFTAFLIISAVFLLATAAICHLINRFSKDTNKAFLIYSFLSIMFLSFGRYYNLLRLETDPKASHMLFWGALTAAGLILILLKKKYSFATTNILNKVSIVLVITCSITFAFRLMGEADYYKYEFNPGKAISVNKYKAGEPDVYYIILDRYASGEMLKKVYDFDNNDFLDFLRKKGFYVADKSRANYENTRFSLASSLNMKFLVLPDKKALTMQVYKNVDNNKVFRLFKSMGYKIIDVGFHIPNSRFARYSKLADVNALNGFEIFFREVKNSSVMSYFLNEWGYFNFKKWYVSNRQFEQIYQFSKMAGPKFIFAHILITHDPYVFERDGSLTSEENERKKDLKTAYIDQVICTNGKVEYLVDKILKESKYRPIIIIQADEGPYPEPLRLKVKHADELIGNQIKEKFGILNAYYFPDGKYEALYPSITPVNSFRIVLNTYFGASLDLLPDDSFLRERNSLKFFKINDRFRD